MQAIIIRILDELRGSWRFRWLALLAAWVVCVAGWVFVFAMPNVYEASARVYVDSQTALGPLLQGLALDPNVESEVSIVRQALLSRPQLEAVSRKTDLHLRAKTPEEMELLLDSLQKHIHGRERGARRPLRHRRPVSHHVPGQQPRRSRSRSSRRCSTTSSSRRSAASAPARNPRSASSRTRSASSSAG